MWMLFISSALALDVGAWQRVLDTYVRPDGAVDYAAIHAAGALDGFLGELAIAEEPRGRSDRVAFWLNAYNALTVDLIADQYPVASIRDLDGGKVWDTRRFPVANRSMTLNEIENRVLRPMGDPRVHAGLNCASKGCPPLFREAFVGSKIDTQLVAASKRWMETTGARVDVTGRTVSLSKIFEWYGEDFVGMNNADIPGFDGKTEGALDYVARYVSEEQAAFLLRGGYKVGWLEYDWALNKP